MVDVDPGIDDGYDGAATGSAGGPRLGGMDRQL